MTGARVFAPEGVDMETLKTERIPGQLRLAIVGGGMIAEKFYGPIIEDLRALHNLTLVALVDPYSGDEFVKNHGCALYGDHNQMLDEMQPDGTIVCAPTVLHGKVAAAALGKGSGVLIEKPLGREMADGEMIRQAQRESGKVVACVSQRRHLRDMIRLRDALEEGVFGELKHIAVTGPWQRGEEYFLDRGSNLRWQGRIVQDWGVLGNQFVHDLDLLRWFMEADTRRTERLAGNSLSVVKSVSAWGGNSRPELMEVPDTMQVDITYMGGRTAHLNVTTNAGAGFVTQYRLTGTRASAHVLGDTIVSWTYADHTKVDPEMPDSIPAGLLTGQGAGAPDSISQEPHRHTVENFAAALRGEQHPHVTLDEAYINLQTLCAAEISMRESMAAGKTVPVPLDTIR